MPLRLRPDALPGGLFFGVVIGLLCAAAATLVRLLLDPLLVNGPPYPYVTYFLAVLVSAGLAGRAGGITALVCGAVVGTYLFVPRDGAFSPAEASTKVGLILFLMIGAATVALAYRWRATEAALRRTQATLAQAGEMAHLGAWSVEDPGEPDQDGKPYYWSDETFRIFGYAPGSVTVDNRFFFSRVHPDDRRRVAEGFREAVVERRPYEVEHRIVRPDGSERLVVEHAEIQFDALGRPRRMIGAVLDVTARRQLEQELRHKAAELVEAGRLKDEFIATVSHELRTPLNAVLGWAELARQGRLAPKDEKRALSIIASNARRQAQLIDDLLDLSRIVAGRLRLEPRVIDAWGPIQAAIDAVLPAADAKGVNLFAGERGAPAMVFGDAARLQQVAWNLLTNAVKFTPPGGTISIHVRARGGQVEIRVRDTGVGIERAFLPHLFDRFRQADGRPSRVQGGLGIGLSIVRHLVEAQGGTVAAESAGADQGSTFVVTLPRTIPESGQRVPPEDVGTPEPAASTLRGLRVLAVDDEPDALALTATVLRQHGAHVVAAQSAGAALEALRGESPDVVVIDIAMPTIDGCELLERIRAMPGPAARVPAVALTAFAREEDVRRTRASGYTAHLAKPVEERVLIRTISELHATSRTA